MLNTLFFLLLSFFLIVGTIESNIHFFSILAISAPFHLIGCEGPAPLLTRLRGKRLDANFTDFADPNANKGYHRVITLDIFFSVLAQKTAITLPPTLLYEEPRQSLNRVLGIRVEIYFPDFSCNASQIGLASKLICDPWIKLPVTDSRWSKAIIQVLLLATWFPSPPRFVSFSFLILLSCFPILLPTISHLPADFWLMLGET